MSLTERLAVSSSRHPWRTILFWLVLLGLAGFLSSRFLADALTTDMAFTNRPEAVRAMDLVEDRFGERGINEIFIVRNEDATAKEPDFETEVRALQAAASERDGVRQVVTAYDSKDPSMTSEDGHSTLVFVNFEEPDEITDYEDDVDAIAASVADGYEALPFGMVSISRDFSEIAEEDVAEGERFGILVALVVLLLVFGAVVAGLIPIGVGIFSIAVALGITALVGTQFDFSFFVTNMISMMGLAVGIDYSLFILSRYREERHHGREKLAAIAAAGRTSSRAVFFSGLTVVLALAGMLIVPTTIFRSLASGAIFVVVVAVAASLTLLPAIIGLLGDRVNALRILRRKADIGGDEHRFWDRITHAVMGRPVVSLLIVTALLLGAASQYLDINTGVSGVSTLPKETETRAAFDVLERDFSGGLSSPIEIVVDADVQDPAVGAAVEELTGLLESDGSFGPVQPQPNEAGDTMLVSVPLRHDPQSDAANKALLRVREDHVPAAFEDAEARVLVGGDTAFNQDFFELTDTYTPIVFAFVLGLSFLLLTVVFRSIVVPIKAILMNLISVGASYGLIVLVFQKGYGAEVFGFQTVEQIEAWLPLFLFSILFGLSMDYHVFLLTRIREHFDRTHDNTASVAHGLRTTGPLITGAATIMVAVFGGFAAGRLVMMQQMGFGLAVAVLLDATLVRSVLVPASMKLLGDRNWYLPKWLRWLPDLNVEGHQKDEDAAPVGKPEPALS